MKKNFTFLVFLFLSELNIVTKASFYFKVKNI